MSLSERRLVGTMHDAEGRGIAFGTEGDEVTITLAAGTIFLAPQQQDQFTRLYQEAERQAEAHGADRTCRYCGGEIEPCETVRPPMPGCKGWVHVRDAAWRPADPHRCEDPAVDPRSPAAEPLSAEAVR